MSIRPFLVPLSGQKRPLSPPADMNLSRPHPGNPHRQGPTATAAIRPTTALETVKTEPIPVPKSAFGPDRVQHPTKQTQGPDGSIRLTLPGNIKVNISPTIIGQGSQSTVRGATVDSPGKHRYPAVAIKGKKPRNVFRDAPFGNIATIRVDDNVYFNVSKRGIPFTDVSRILRTYPLPTSPGLKYAFILKYTAKCMDTLRIIHAANRAHQDVKPDNMIILKKDGATMIDIDQIPEIGNPSFLSTREYESPDRHRKVAKPAADIYAIGEMLQSDFCEIAANLRPTDASEISAIIRGMKHPSNRLSLHNAQQKIADYVTRYTDGEGPLQSEFRQLEQWFFNYTQPQIGVTAPSRLQPTRHHP